MICFFSDTDSKCNSRLFADNSYIICRYEMKEKTLLQYNIPDLSTFKDTLGCPIIIESVLC